MELEAFNIKVIVIEPGAVKTEFFEVANEKALQNLPTIENTPYRPTYEKIKGLEQQTESMGWTPQQVAKTIIRALRARNPRPRYVAATGGRIFIFLMTKVLPTWVTDTFWKRFYGINQIAKEWQKKVIEN